MDVSWSLSLFNHVWFSSSATKGSSRCFSHRHVWVSCWCFLEIRSDFLGRPSAARLGRPTLPARGCSFTAVLTEAVICLAGRGWCCGSCLCSWCLQQSSAVVHVPKTVGKQKMTLCKKCLIQITFSLLLIIHWSAGFMLSPHLKWRRKSPY